MHPLDQAHLSTLPASVVRPGYDRSKVKAGIAHIGVGGFHRAHLAIYLDRALARPGQEQWGLCGINLLPQDAAMAAAMKRQDGLYTVSEMAPDGTHTSRVVEAMVEYLYAQDNPKAVLDRLSQPDIRIVSLTITEGGYLIDERGQFNLKHPSVVYDLEHPGEPHGAFGYIVEALDRRRKAGIKPFTVMSCDNLRHNGVQARRACVAFAKAKDPELAAWIEREVGFPNAMVDRITPATDNAARQKLRDLTGVDDAAPVICEDFIQWVLEDDFRNGRPEWDAVGVMITPDVSPYEEAKIRLLNATHTMLSYPAYLAGFRKVDDVLHDELFTQYLRDFLNLDAGYWLKSLPGLEIDAYKAKLLQRFGNRAVGDQVARLCMDGGSKISGFLLPTLHEILKHGRPYHRIAFFLASYERYLKGKDERGEAYPIVEPNARHLMERVIQSSSPSTLLELTEVVGTQLPAHPGFVALYLQLRQKIDTQGVVATLKEIVAAGDKLPADAAS
ncbi:mannitol dehydrogenase family protein [Stigmatella sp. ncwal1]|uniref:Mannitol dehydrogenase family protein n=1 Tax=Stigmatella ashevillensis TaxID=2995309 RepID=A0ABT5DJI5_9BACT|nr:mannitol dehydrogenase family protein [Stigmatella ashevillena]MDC0713816.1 mannitol dehydrogenase family protein [Stigmatella ashevillena]